MISGEEQNFKSFFLIGIFMKSKLIKIKVDGKMSEWIFLDHFHFMRLIFVHTARGKGSK